MNFKSCVNSISILWVKKKCIRMISFLRWTKKVSQEFFYKVIEEKLQTIKRLGNFDSMQDHWSSQLRKVMKNV